MIDFISERPIKKQYFSIGEVARILNERTFVIRFWTNEFFKVIKRVHHGNRLYSRIDLAKLHVIQNLLRVEKYTINGAKQKLGIK